MKLVIQRVSKASCEVESKLISSIERGLLIFTCFENEDNQETIDKAIYKILNLRIFDDENGKMNFSIEDIKGSILHISQFTLSWQGTRGHRPSFEKSMPAREANLKFELMSRKMAESVPLSKGVFGADMRISLVNDGPVTFHLDIK